MPVFACALLLLVSGVAPALTADQPGSERLAGNWKITYCNGSMLTSGWLLKLETKDGKITGQVDTMPTKQDTVTTLVKLDVKDDELGVALKMGNIAIRVDCKIPRGDIKKLYGLMNYGGQLYPVQLEATKLDTAKDLKSLRLAIPKGTFKEQQATVAKQADELKVFYTAAGLLPAADAEKVSAADLQEALVPMLKAAGEYGWRWLVEMQMRYADGLCRYDAYAAVAEKLARDAQKLSPKGGNDMQLRNLEILKLALQKQKKTADVAKVEDSLYGLEAKKHDLYEKTGLGFTPAKAPARKGNRVVLVELFTGAQCPPCVAVDLAFEGLGKTYKTSDVVLLQYHLHIPTADPMTNPDTVARQKYYDVQSTPSLFFNGKRVAQGGGDKKQAEANYKEYREMLDPRLAESTKTTLSVEAQRAGDVVTINAAAAGYAPGAKLRLRLALVEPWVHFPGGNGLTFHAHVVRALVGGPDGLVLPKASVKQTAKVDLAELRETTTKYLEGVKGLTASRPLRYRNLLVVAFLQDDATQEVLHAVEVPIK
jgi:hypothetical protein